MFELSENNAYMKKLDMRKQWFNNESTRIRIEEGGKYYPNIFKPWTLQTKWANKIPITLTGLWLCIKSILIAFILFSTEIIFKHHKCGPKIKYIDRYLKRYIDKVNFGWKFYIIRYDHFILY